MTWQLMWRNVKAVALNATLQLLVIYRLAFTSGLIESRHDKNQKVIGPIYHTTGAYCFQSISWLEILI